MLLVITIPAYNEEKTISKVIQEIPKKISGIDKIKIVVINDGSTDKTKEIVTKNRAIVVSNFKNMGLAYSFQRGLNYALDLGADIIVNTDADFQYNQKQIPNLIRPILQNSSDIVLGSRFAGNIEEMPLQKRIGNILATKVVKFLSGQKITDAQTGFRAFSREAALRMNITSNYTYTQETILQATEHKLKIIEIPIEFRKREGNSRLISNIFSYAYRAGLTLLKAAILYWPLRIFFTIGVLLIFLGIFVGSKVLFHYFETGVVSPYMPSALLSSVLIIIGFQLFIIGLIADMISYNRKTLDEILYRAKSKK